MLPMRQTFGLDDECLYHDCDLSDIPPGGLWWQGMPVPCDNDWIQRENKSSGKFSEKMELTPAQRNWALDILKRRRISFAKLESMTGRYAYETWRNWLQGQRPIPVEAWTLLVDTLGD